MLVSDADLVIPKRTLSVLQLPQTSLHGRSHFQLIVQDTTSGEKFVANYPPPVQTQPDAHVIPEYVHHLDETLGVLETYQVLATDSLSQLRSTRPVASVVFDPSSERIVAVSSATPGDPVHSRFTTLGDDSLLLKYLNPHSILVASVSPPHAAAEPYFGAKDDQAASEIRLHLTLVDSVSAKVIYRGSLESATAPVHAVLVENSIVATYWNTKAKRCELSSVSLFEGVIDRYGLTPFAPKQSAAAAAKVQQRKNFSAFSSSAPLAMQKTFVLPKAVTAVQHTTTAQGLANKNLLLGLTSGQVYALDARHISPRRPVTEPSQAEREEGLGIYQPFVQLHPHSAVTHNYALGSGPTGIVSAPTKLESSSLVFTFGRPDVHYNRVIPSGGFDLLASDFNYGLLSVLLLGLGVVVYWLRFLSKKKAIAQAWA